MFITNELTPAEVLAELLKGRRTTVAATEIFKGLKHDKHLLPKFTENVNSIFDVYKAYRSGAHDIQGPRDDGTDILLKYKDEDEEYRVGLQIKSNDEFNQWSSKKLNLVEKLKAQYAVAKENINVKDYYIIICVDDRKHRNRIRTVCSELKNFKDCTIIEPQEALGFFDLNSLDIVIRTTRLLCAGDTILQAATEEADGFEPDIAYFIVALICEFFSNSEQIDEGALVALWADWEELIGSAEGADDRFAGVVQALISGGILQDPDGVYSIDPTSLPSALCALYFDLKVRKLMPAHHLRGYIVGLLQIMERMHPEADEC